AAGRLEGLQWAIKKDRSTPAGEARMSSARRRLVWATGLAIVVLSWSRHNFNEGEPIGGHKMTSPGDDDGNSNDGRTHRTELRGVPTSDCASCGRDRGQWNKGDEQRHRHQSDTGGGLVLIKSFKTGSTTLATYIAQVGHQRRSYFLHPKATGWFGRGELESRRDEGQAFDISLRHVTPYTPYGVLEELVPGAAFVTIMRRPAERFLSLFNFRGDIKKKYKTPQALVTEIRAGRVPQSDARPFCNQLAWLMSGRDGDFSKIVDADKAQRVASEVIEEAERRGVVVLITERMSESVAVLAHLMQWDMDTIELNVGSQRVHDAGRGYFSCSDADTNNKCISAIRGCNLVDEVLYEHYERQFEALVRTLPSRTSERVGAMLGGHPKAKHATSMLDVGKFPVNCISSSPGAKTRTGRGNGGRVGDGLASPESNEELYRRLHSCNGRPR
ncbi:unnamed protein product, partial [Ectocarpus fasciculatus]